jgi:diacylglycerol O-acyltransferase / wax synthase
MRGRTNAPGAIGGVAVTVESVALTRLRMDELINAWVGDHFTPFQIALLGVFDAAPFLLPDGSVDVPRIRCEIVARARRVAAFRRRVLWTRFGEGMPVWAEDPSFEPDRHIEGATLPAEEDLATWAAGRILRPLPLDRPLWRAEVVDGLPDGRFAVIVVVHHVLADGITGVALAASLLDPAPDATPHPSAPRATPCLPTHRDIYRDRLRGLAAGLGRIRAGRSADRRAGHRLRAVRSRLQETRALLRTRTSETSLPRTVGPTRRLVVVRWPLEELRDRGHALGVTVNDLLLAAVTGGLRKLLLARGDDVDLLTIRTSVPAATREGRQASGILLVDLPVHEGDLLRRLELVHRATAEQKRGLNAGTADITDVMHLPPPLARVGVRWLRRFGGTRVNLFVSNVPGPPAPLWLAGARLLEAVPVAPLVQHVGLCVAALSYAGELGVSVHADGSVTELELFADGMAADFAALRAASPTPSGFGPATSPGRCCSPLSEPR